MKKGVLHIVAAAVAVALVACATHMLDGYYMKRQAAPVRAVSAASADAADPLASFEINRQQLRARRRAQLNELIHDAGADEDTLLAARRQLLDDMEREDQEETLQGLLRARGFEGAVASVSGGTACVFVRAQSLNRQQAAVILELVTRQTGITGGNVKIIPIN